MTSLKGRVAVVAGASRGAGKGIALALGDAGATVYVVGRTAAGGPRPADNAPGPSTKQPPKSPPAAVWVWRRRPIARMTNRWRHSSIALRRITAASTFSPTPFGALPTRMCPWTTGWCRGANHSGSSPRPRGG